MHCQELSYDLLYHHTKPSPTKVRKGFDQMNVPESYALEHFRSDEQLFFLLGLLNIINLFAIFSEEAKDSRRLNDIGKCIRVHFLHN